MLPRRHGLCHHGSLEPLQRHGLPYTEGRRPESNLGRSLAHTWKRSHPPVVPHLALLFCLPPRVVGPDLRPVALRIFIRFPRFYSSRNYTKMDLERFFLDLVCTRSEKHFGMIRIVAVPVGRHDAPSPLLQSTRETRVLLWSCAGAFGHTLKDIPEGSPGVSDVSSMIVITPSYRRAKHSSLPGVARPERLHGLSA